MMVAPAINGWLGAAFLAALAGAPALADGYYTSFDLAPSKPMAVVSVDRGPLTYAAAAGRGDDGERWGKGAVLYVWNRDGLRLKAGPSVYVSSKDGRHIGLRVGADCYRDRGAWASYWMAEYDTTQQASLALVSADWKVRGIGVELSVWHERHEKAAPTLMARWKMPGHDASLRAGWRFKEREAFVGVSLSRF
ncbi:hypothetical protein DRW48_15520 [Paracoccus suum]|uniref:Uncharacterized protein n=1 Tax=Paracoccus suum TaxID=2259340 RepID=A0A344PNE6_9RHOB|nr:hypothetical protein [Paracoccus suum]AXC50901.1 hypothetical protein DRW48_15520 [Paracoccus suum]